MSQVGLHGQLLLVSTLALWYVHPSLHLACNHTTIPGLYSAPPLIRSSRLYSLPTCDPPGPDIVAMGTAGDEAGFVSYLLFEPDTLSASVCGSADAPGAVFSAEVSDAWVGHTVGRASERVLGAVYMCRMVDLDASLAFVTS